MKTLHRTLLASSVALAIAGGIMQASMANEAPVAYNTINDNLLISQNQKARHINTVNGDVRVQTGAHVEHINTVSGDLWLEPNVRVEALHTVNGDVFVDRSVNIGQIDTVNGDLDIRQDSGIKRLHSVNGDLQANAARFGQIDTVNGDILLKNATVTGDITTFSGGIKLTGTTRIDGSIVYEKPKNWRKSDKDITLSIGPHVVVKGKIVLHHPVRLDIHPDAKTGQIVKTYQ
ncbi:MAG: hypothetical protein D6694_08995 [Gammaproteobacteria bacterium]|nr:MAG: hypothetical protein D6694_08995 [Gammaproteobacteria bacterium]